LLAFCCYWPTWFSKSNGDLKDGLDAVALGLIAIGLSPWIARVFKSLESGGLKMEFTQAQTQLDQQKRAIEAMSFMLTRFLPFWELHHLQALVDGTEFTVDPETQEMASLEAQLRDLRERGFNCSPVKDNDY
jgi:hypothetical protein